jgi:hypothetical protein
MRLLLLLVFFCLYSYLSRSQSETKSILILGDSYLKGHFGEYLHKKMHEQGKYNILSIAIGGAGSKTFLPPMQNQCCGYRVRVTNAGDSLLQNKKSKTVKVPVLESADKPTAGFVMKMYQGKLDLLLEQYKPDAVILVMGENYLNAHDELLKIIDTYNKNIPLVWIGPFDKNNSTKRYNLIEEALKDRQNSLLVRSFEVLGRLNITATHFYGIQTKKIADGIYEQFAPFLEEYFSDQDNKGYWNPLNFK